MASLLTLERALLRRMLSNCNKRFVSTSKSNKTVATAESAVETRCEPPVKNWMSYGFDTKSKELDRNITHSTLFASITLCLIGGGFIYTYAPDYNLKDWAQREAFLELKRRETKGLPLIDPNLVNPKKIKLPSDKELGNTEIII